MYIRTYRPSNFDPTYNMTPAQAVNYMVLTPKFHVLKVDKLVRELDGENLHLRRYAFPIPPDTEETPDNLYDANTGKTRCSDEWDLLENIDSLAYAVRRCERNYDVCGLPVDDPTSSLATMYIRVYYRVIVDFANRIASTLDKYACEEGEDYGNGYNLYTGPLSCWYSPSGSKLERPVHDNIVWTHNLDSRLSYFEITRSSPSDELYLDTKNRLRGPQRIPRNLAFEQEDLGMVRWDEFTSFHHDPGFLLAAFKPVYSPVVNALSGVKSSGPYVSCVSKLTGQLDICAYCKAQTQVQYTVGGCERKYHEYYCPLNTAMVRWLRSTCSTRKRLSDKTCTRNSCSANCTPSSRTATNSLSPKKTKTTSMKTVALWVNKIRQRG